MKTTDNFLNLLPDEIKESILTKEKMRSYKREFHKYLAELKSNGEYIDTFSLYSLFGKYFLTNDMMDDFRSEAQSFIKENFSKLHEYHNLHYLSEDYLDALPDTLFVTRIFNCILNALVEGNESAKNIIIRLYKKFYKKEYNSLKHFNIITEENLLDITDCEESGFEISVQLSRMIVMCGILGKELDSSVDSLLLLLNEVYDTDKKENCFPCTYEKFTHETSNYSEFECYWEFQDILSDIDDDYRKMCDTHHLKLWEFHKAVLNQNDFTDDHLLSRYLNDYKPDEGMADVLFLLKNISGNKFYEYDELQEYSIIYILTSAYCKLYKMIDKSVDEFMFFDGSKLESKAEPFKIMPSANKKKDHIETASTTEELEVLKNQIAELQKELHKKEQDEVYIRQLYNEEKKKVKDAEVNLLKYNQEHDELFALREHVYNMTETSEEPASMSVDEMLSVIKAKQIAIVGGNPNWINKMKTIFPNFRYIKLKESSAISDSAIENVDKVYFFTDTLSHCTYNRFMNIVAKKNIPFGYIHTVNMDAIIKQLYNDFSIRLDTKIIKSRTKKITP